MQKFMVASMGPVGPCSWASYIKKAASVEKFRPSENSVYNLLPISHETR